MKWFRTFYFFFALATYCSVSILISIFPFSKTFVQKIRIKSVRQFSKWGLAILNMQVKIKSPISKGSPYFIICNHVSYLDILVLASQVECIFVTSKEIENTPLLGFLCRGAGCVFVERRNRTTLDQDNAELSHALTSNMSVAVFPEGTSSNGETVLPFKSGLFESARNSKSQILPLCIRYQAIDSVRLNPLNRDEIFYYGEMTFLSHLLKLLSHHKIEIELEALDTIEPNQFSNRKELSIYCFEKISQAYATR